MTVSVCVPVPGISIMWLYQHIITDRRNNVEEYWGERERGCWGMQHFLSSVVYWPEYCLAMKTNVKYTHEKLTSFLGALTAKLRSISLILLSDLPALVFSVVKFFTFKESNGETPESGCQQLCSWGIHLVQRRYLPWIQPWQSSLVISPTCWASDLIMQ